MDLDEAHEKLNEYKATISRVNLALQKGNDLMFTGYSAGEVSVVRKTVEDSDLVKVDRRNWPTADEIEKALATIFNAGRK